MTIKELMEQVNVERVIDAFLLLDPYFSECDYKTTVLDQYKKIPKVKKAIKENIKLFIECKIENQDDPHTLFIFYDQDGDYEQKWKKSFSCFLINDEEILSVFDKDFHLLDSGEIVVTQYSFGHESIEQIAHHSISNLSIKELGKEICAANILSEMFWWGLDAQDREKNVQKLIDDAEDESDCLSEDEFSKIMKELKKELKNQISDDEKAYYAAREKFDDETKEIIRRYENKVIEETQQKWITILKKEYKK